MAELQCRVFVGWEEAENVRADVADFWGEFTAVGVCVEVTTKIHWGYDYLTSMYV